MIIPVLLAGGSGTRLWPLSRKLYPKQFMRLVGSHTLLQSTLLRLSSLEEVQAPIILCNAEHRFIVAEQLREIDIQPQEIILEPVGRNTAPALAVAALRAQAIEDNALMLALPSDHHIDDTQGFVRTAIQGARFARQDKLVTFGIVPTEPETGYGYIRKGDELIAEGAGKGPGVWRIDQFVEKPDLDTAKSYVTSGDFCWNSGMFIFKAGFMLDDLKKQSPQMVSACSKAIENGKADLDFFRLDEEAFRACPSDSIDYALMEKTTAGVMVALASGWSDLGSWEALWQAGPKDGNGNVIIGDACLEDVRNSYIHTSGRLVTAVGLNDHVVVETKDAVFVAPRDHVQQVKTLVDQLKQKNRNLWAAFRLQAGVLTGRTH